MNKRNIPRAQTIVSVIWARVESNMFRLQPVGVGVGPVESLHGDSCLDEEGGLRG